MKYNVDELIDLNEDELREIYKNKIAWHKRFQHSGKVNLQLSSSWVWA